MAVYGWTHLQKSKDGEVDKEDGEINIRVRDATHVYLYTDDDKKPICNMPYYFSKFFGDFTVTVQVTVKGFDNALDKAGILIKPSKPTAGVFITCAIEHHHVAVMSNEIEDDVARDMLSNYAVSHVCTEPPEKDLKIGLITPRNDGAESGLDIADTLEKNPSIDFVCENLQPETCTCWFRVVRSGNNFTTSYSIEGGDFKKLWSGDFIDEEGLQVGVFGACPNEDGFKAKFEDFDISGV